MSNEAQFLNLPSHLINDILSRLPAKTIIQCKSVCKTWLHLLSQSEFINLHLSRSPLYLIVSRIDLNSTDPIRFGLVEFEDEPDQNDYRNVEGHKIQPPKISAGNRFSVTMVGSINGLICLNESNIWHDAVYLWNPSTQEFITLPKPEGVSSYTNIIRYGFGLSSQTGQYKVVRIFWVLDKNTSRILESNCDVYTLGEENQGLGLWRRIGHAPFVFIRSEYGIFLNGNLHWLIKDQDGDCQSISCFDLEKELFLPFPAPPELKDFHLASLGVLGGCLSLCYNASDCEIVIWVMKKNGNTKTWSKEIVINKGPDSLVGTIREDVRVLKVFKDGDVLLLWGVQSFALL